ncbi:hypothetical protein K458DRAFT_370386 [Lentithecium fluviatile CBS 122367]|uniref:Uncharacterized protein n=1 Tax=Lentithecium fluviatile CBS 122367 TaxID=1168545 RepID=A0A6G1IW52_9PLEO|nr:hypothetical protein K458DRAFT_370386 [Lentithecium fluviatile CBS 122367]
MWESTTNFTFANTEYDWWCRFNTTRLYYNVTDLDYCRCNVTFSADPDISGIGVMTSFAGMSLCTIIVALLPAWHDTSVRQKARFKWLLRPNEDESQSFEMALENSSARLSEHIADRDGEEAEENDEETTTLGSQEQNDSKEKHHRWLSLAEKLLGNLCDLQLLTGAAIITAAFAQGDGLSFYHQCFVINYWWFALNSFWAARLDEAWNDSNPSASATAEKSDPSNQASITASNETAVGTSSIIQRIDAFFRGTERFRSYLRRFLVFICAASFSVLYGRSIWAQNYKDWNTLVSGRCYLFHDKSAWNSDWFWLAGVSLYALVLMLSLVNRTKEMLVVYSEGLHSGEERLFRDCVVRWREAQILSRNPKGPRNWRWRARLTGNFFVYLGAVVLALIYSACAQFLAIWSFGDGFYALEVCFYLGMWAWSFYDIVDLKISNSRLVVGNETAWGFGQVLAVVLMGAFVFYVVDGLGEEKGKDMNLKSISV